MTNPTGLIIAVRRRLKPEHDALGEGVQTVHQFQLCITTQGEHLVVLLQLVGDHVEAGHELIETLFAQILVGTFKLVPFGGDLVQLSHPLQV